jgi:hypothetical protein
MGKTNLAYVVEYYKDGVRRGSSPHAGPLENAKLFAEDGLIRHGADFARIMDVDGSGAEIWSVRRDAPRS